MKRAAYCLQDQLKNECKDLQIQLSFKQIENMRYRYLLDIQDIEKYYADESHEMCNYTLDQLKQNITLATTKTQKLIENMSDKRRKKCE